MQHRAGSALWAFAVRRGKKGYARERRSGAGRGEVLIISH